MAEQNQKSKEYTVADFGKVLLVGWKTIVVCTLIVGLLIGGILSCLAVFVTHDEFYATIAKIDSSYDVPIIQSTMKENIHKLLKDSFADSDLTDSQIWTLTREINDHLEIINDEKSQTYDFTLSSFDSAVIPKLKAENFYKILKTIMDYYADTYTQKITASYTIHSTVAGDSALENLRRQNYYRQAETLISSIDSILEEISAITQKVIITETSILISPNRSEFYAYLCKENNSRVEDINRELNDLKPIIQELQSDVVKYAVEKENTVSTVSYFRTQALNYPEVSKWTTLQAQWGQSQASAPADIEDDIVDRIDEITTQIDQILGRYNVIAEDYAESIISDYVIISSLIENETVGALRWMEVALLTAACMFVAFLVAYVVQFVKMQRKGEIGSEPTDEADY